MQQFQCWYTTVHYLGVVEHKVVDLSRPSTQHIGKKTSREAIHEFNSVLNHQTLCPHLEVVEHEVVDLCGYLHACGPAAADDEGQQLLALLLGCLRRPGSSKQTEHARSVNTSG